MRRSNLHWRQEATMVRRRIEITTVTSTALGDGEDRCDDQRTCPGVHRVADRPGLYYVIVTEVTDHEELAAFGGLIGPGELLGTMPCRVIDEAR
jgi:hypothetical protein